MLITHPNRVTLAIWESRILTKDESTNGCSINGQIGRCLKKNGAGNISDEGTGRIGLQKIEKSNDSVHTMWSARPKLKLAPPPTKDATGSIQLLGCVMRPDGKLAKRLNVESCKGHRVKIAENLSHKCTTKITTNRF